MPIQIAAPTADEIRRALKLLLSRVPSEDPEIQVDSISASVDRGELSLDGLRVARVDGGLVGAVMGVRLPDGTVHLWIPNVSDNAPDGTTFELMQECRRWIERSHAKMAQCVTPLEDHAAHRLLEDAGFERLTDLACWQHDLEEMPHAPLPDDCEIVPFSLENADQFERVMEQTYDGSQDCTALRGRRSAKDSLAAHRQAVDEESRHWNLYRCDGEDVGIVLCADHRDQRMWELLYLGVVPRFRQQQFGLAMVCDALMNAQESGAEGMFLAADDANEAAANLYAACGFSIAFRQRIHVWFPVQKPSS